jgi:crotonobetainyl-CoA:carnitine CoA-transferase CaiB-like acyl-CoA transferase
VTCSVTGFGETGPHTQRPAFDQVVQAMGGGMSITGTPETGPTRSGIPIGDLGGGMFGVMGVLAALAERERTGRGQHVDISMLDAQISLLNYMATMHLMSGHVPAGIGNGHFVHVPYNSYPTADGHIIIACIGDAFFERFVEFIDLPALRKPEYLQQPVRYAAKAEIDAIVGAELQKQPTAYWLERLRAARIPCGPVNNFEQALNDVQVRARDMVVEVPLKTGEMLRMPGNPIKLSAASPKTYTCPPALGEHTRSVLTQLAGYSPEQLEQLRRDGAIA